jgi:hypothetical protein
MRRYSEPEDLFETISQTLLNAVDRDAYSGWGAMVTIMYVISVQYPYTSANRLFQDTRQGHHPDAQRPHGLSRRYSECILCSNPILCNLHHALLHCSIALPPFLLERNIMLATDQATAFPYRLIPRH